MIRTAAVSALVVSLLAIMPRLSKTSFQTAPEGVGSRRRAVERSVPPTAVPDNYSLGKDAPLTVAGPGILANDTMNHGAIASYGASTGTEQTSIGTSTPTAQSGSITLNGDGDFSYSPASGFSGTDTFMYVVANSAGRSTALVTLTVIANPAAVADAYGTAPDMPLVTPAPGVLGNDTLSGASIVSYGASTGAERTTLGAATATSQQGTVTLNADGSFSYVTPPKMRDYYGDLFSFTGADTFKYIIQSGLSSSTATVTINVHAGGNADFNVTTPGFYFQFDGITGENPPLTLVRGRKYTFQINDAPIHLFEILDAPPGSVTNNNISEGVVTFTVPMTATNYRYHCSIHDFGNMIVTVGP